MINADELLFVVDEDNKPQQPQPRSLIHANKIWHRVSHVIIVNNKNEILCQKRSMLKDLSPGKWDARFGGHMTPGQTYKESARKELSEEIGIFADDKDFQPVLEYKDVLRQEYQGVFLVSWSGELSNLRLEKDEVDAIRWVSIDELKKAQKNHDPNWVLIGYENDVFMFIKN